MKKNLTYYIALGSALLTLLACDDNTATLGVEMMPKSDIVTKTYKTYDVTTESYAVGARTCPTWGASPTPRPTPRS